MSAAVISTEGAKAFVADYVVRYREAIAEDIARTVSNDLCIHCHEDEAVIEGLVCRECYARAIARNSARTTSEIGSSWGNVA